MWTPDQADQHLISILDLLKTIKINEVTILTGSNGSGKSLIRKALPTHIAEQLGIPAKSAVGSVSMEQRTKGNPDWGALSSVLMDNSEEPTSLNTWELIKQIIAQINRYIVIDEPEIGAGEEIQLALTDEINAAIHNARAQNDFKGCLIITHSRTIVKNLTHDSFINLDGMIEKDWLNRIPKRGNLADLEHNSLELYRAVIRRL